ncbi:MAG: 2-C-methyl-D-erythritol 4-phosphate cytidylyltransferase [Euzebya sp.]
MHDPHLTGPAGPVASTLRVRHHDGPTQDPGVRVLDVPEDMADPLRCPTGQVLALTEGMDPSDVVVFVPQTATAADVGEFLWLIRDLPTTVAVAASARPVTDALKRVRGSTVAGGVDRAGLRRVVLPAAVRMAALRAALDRADHSIRPLRDIARSEQVPIHLIQRVGSS